MRKTKSFALTFLLGLSLICVCAAAFGVAHPDGSFATPDFGDSLVISFKHLNNEHESDYPYGYYTNVPDACKVGLKANCFNDCSGVPMMAAATLISDPTSDIAVTSLVFNTVGIDLPDTISNFCAVRDGAGNVWAIDRDLPTGSNITTANSSSRVIPCIDSDIFNPVTGCRAFKSEISIEGGFIKLDTMNGSEPLNVDCSMTEHLGRMVFEHFNDLLYICSETGWKTFSSDP